MNASEKTNFKEKYYTTSDVAAILNCTKEHASFLCRTGKIKAVRPFGHWLIDKTSFDKRVKGAASDEDFDI